MKTPAPAKPIMFYDGGCPLCRREVALYRRLDRSQRITWLDISASETRLEDYGLTLEGAMRELHVMGADGVMYRGAAAFPPIWAALPYLRRLAPLTRLPGVLPALERVYRLFARWRLRERCAEGRCVHAAEED
jgi:predicted DCC family thiol-disulfide oxidoreductase YuxK